MMVLSEIPVTLGLPEIKANLRVRDNETGRQLEKVAGEVLPLIAPKAAYKISYIESKDSDALVIDGVRFVSRVLRKNLEEVGRVFPYVVTIGDALEKKASTCDDLLDKYFIDSIGTMAVGKARKCLEDHLRSRFRMTTLSFMGPGSLPDWPIEEQKNLFCLMGNVEDSIGVKLTDNCLMLPVKSLSGIYFPTEIPFFTCQLCHRESCPGRKAKYSRTLAKEYGLDEK